MRLTLHDGGQTRTVSMPWARLLGVLDVAPHPALPNVADALETALANPDDMPPRWERRFQSGDSVVIVVSDNSRATGLSGYCAALVDWLQRRGIAEERLSFLVATGVHRPATAAEKAAILGTTVYERFKRRVHNHDAQDAANLVHVGTTRRGTPVRLNRLACECDHLILTGAVTPHYFAGFGGGRKAFVPGLAAAETIARNHVRSLHPAEPRLDPHVRICVLDGNPVAEDLLEAAQLHPPAFIVNTVLNGEGAVAGIFAGALDAAHRNACAFARRLYCVPIAGQADLVIAAASDTTNFIQCHKALFNAYAALKPGGRIVLLAPAREGLGGDGFRRYLQLGDPEAIVAALRQHPDINGQTALSTLQKGGVTTLVTEMDETDVALCGATKAASLEDALDQARCYFQERGISTPTCYYMPNASATVPLCDKAMS